MNRVNAIGTVFTIGLLSVLLFVAVYRLMVESERLLDCYQEQLRNAVTVLDGKEK
jgi:hypothetical protein